MPEPTLTYYRVQDNPFNRGSVQPNSIRHMNGGGVVAQALLGSGNPAYLDFSTAQAGGWCKPQILLMEFGGDTAVGVTFRLYDATTNKENMFPGSGDQWDMRIKLSGTLYDPNDADGLQSAMGAYNTWPVMIVGGDGVAGYSFDSNLPTPLNKSQQVGGDPGYPLVIQDAVNSTIHRTNFYIYLVVKPKANAASGEHVDWSARTTLNFPGGS